MHSTSYVNTSWCVMVVCAYQSSYIFCLTTQHLPLIYHIYHSSTTIYHSSTTIYHSSTTIYQTLTTSTVTDESTKLPTIHIQLWFMDQVYSSSSFQVVFRIIWIHSYWKYKVDCIILEASSVGCYSGFLNVAISWEFKECCTYVRRSSHIYSCCYFYVHM